jgi:TonB family protein
MNALHYLFASHELFAWHQLSTSHQLFASHELSASHELLARASLWLWPTLANHLWQATLFAALVFGLTLLLREASARERYALWLVASAKFAVPSSLVAFFAARLGVGASWLTGAGTDAPLVLRLAEPLRADASDVVVTVSTGAGARSHEELFCVLTLLWLTGAAWLFVVWLKRRREFPRSMREGRETYFGREFDALERARARLGLKREVLLVLSSQRTEPGVWRTRRPVLVLSEKIVGELDDEELEAVLLHELAHVERRDNLFGNLQTALACVFWFNPVVWLVGRGLLAERERACDERVLEAGGAADAYAASILKVVRFCSGWRVAGVSGAASGSNLRRRIEMIMQDEKGRRLSAWRRVLTCALAASALALTVCAGLVSRVSTAEAHMLEGFDAPQRATRVIVRDGDHEGKVNEQGPAVREIEQATEAVVPFENVANAPLVINDARMRLITLEQLRRADAEGADSFDDDESPLFITMPTVTLTNVSGKAIREVGVGFETGGKISVIAGYAVSIKPGAAETIRSGWRHNIIMPGDFSTVTVRLVWVSFADDTQWGARARAPHPPPPPPSLEPALPPAPPASGSAVAPVIAPARPVPPSEAVPALASGEGIGSGEGSGEGEGKGGVGVGKRIGLSGKRLYTPEPVYPAIARAAGAQGTVSVRITVDEDGDVIAAEAVSGHPLLYTAAVDAARESKFKPTLVDGKPVKVSGVISYVFALK